MMDADLGCCAADDVSPPRCFEPRSEEKQFQGHHFPHGSVNVVFIEMGSMPNINHILLDWLKMPELDTTGTPKMQGWLRVSL